MAHLTLTAPAAQSAPRLIRALEQLFRRLAHTLRDPYRPELHYMRGPGPKWHAKHGKGRPVAGRSA